MTRNKIFLSIILIWSLAPIIWQLYSSFCTEEAIINPFSQIENRWTMENYIQILHADPPFWRYLFNSSLLGLISTFTTLLISIPAAYSISKTNYIVSNVSKAFLLAAALFPYVILFLALLQIARTFNLGNNLFALSIPYTALSLPLAVLLLSSAFKNIPKDLEDAARLEGLGVINRLRWVLIPLVSPAIASTAILVFLFSWNEYPIALTWLSQSELLTLPVAIARIAGSSVYSVPYGAYAAATVLGTMPLILIVITFQKQIISGLTDGAIKG